jgi:MFS family permease
VVTAYGLTFGGLLLLGGRAADLLGRRRIFMLGLVVFTVASLACGLAGNDAFLIVMRGVQGAGAAIVLPAALSIVMNMFPEGAARNKALGLWGAIAASGATVGLITGGLLTRYVGWEYIFFLNVPIGVVVLALAPRVVPESRLETARRRYDPLGALSVTGGLLLLVYAFIFIGTLYMQQVLGYSALETGLAWLATSVTSVALAGLSQLLVTRIGAAPVLAAGMAMIAGGMLWATQVIVQGRFWADLAGPFFVVGAGTAFAFIPISIAGLTGVAERDAGLASGLLNTAQQLGGAIGVAVTSTVATSHAGTLLAEGRLPNAALTGDSSGRSGCAP